MFRQLYLEPCWPQTSKAFCDSTRQGVRCHVATHSLVQGVGPVHIEVTHAPSSPHTSAWPSLKLPRCKADTMATFLGRALSHHYQGQLG